MAILSNSQVDPELPVPVYLNAIVTLFVLYALHEIFPELTNSNPPGEAV